MARRSVRQRILELLETGERKPSLLIGLAGTEAQVAKALGDLLAEKKIAKRRRYGGLHYRLAQ